MYLVTPDTALSNSKLSSFKKNITSQYGEDGIIERIFAVLKKSHGWCVELGAWDGRFGSNTFNLLTNHGWSGVLIEADYKKYQELVQNYKDMGRVYCLNKLVNFNKPDTLDDILTYTPLPPQFDLLVIDVDGNDYHIWDSVVKYSVDVVVIEINPSIPADVEFVQLRDLNINHGSSLLSMVKLGQVKDYKLIATTTTNAFFVKSQYYPLFKIENNDPRVLYEQKKYLTQIFQLYDGTLVLTGNKKLIWHKTDIKSTDIQVLPKYLRKFPERLNPFARRLAQYGWRGLTRILADLVKSAFGRQRKL